MKHTVTITSYDGTSTQVVLTLEGVGKVKRVASVEGDEAIASQLKGRFVNVELGIIYTSPQNATIRFESAESTAGSP